MNDQAKVAALAAELKGIGKLPQWIGSGPKNTWAIFEDATPETVLREDAVLAALSGVAAEVLQDAQIVIIRGELYHADNSHHSYVWEVWQFDHDGSEFICQHETRHEALIEALKQIETEEAKR